MMREVDPVTLAVLETRIRDFAEARYQLALFDGRVPALVYAEIDAKSTYADVLRTTTTYDERTIEKVSSFAQEVFREKWSELEDLHSSISASDRVQ